MTTCVLDLMVLFLHAADEQDVRNIVNNFKEKSSTDYEAINM